MQNKFRKTVKKVAAIGTGVAMLGMTLTGALAADLSNYPSGLGLKKDSSTVLVVGAAAGDSVSDNAAATDIAAGLPVGAKSSGGVSLAEGKKEEDIPLGLGIANTPTIGFDKSIEDDDVNTLIDTKINFKSSDYDVREVLLLAGSDPQIATSLTSGDDDYKSDIVMETTARDKVKYFYAFDDSINIGNATSSNPLTLKFLGKTLKIVGTDSNTKFTAYVGAEYFLQSGESVVVNGKKITLKNVGSTGSIVIDVDGVTETISSANTETVNGIEITNDEAFYTSAGVEQTAASLVIGKDASDTYFDGDYYPGGDETCDGNSPNDPDCWLWTVGGLQTTGSTTIDEKNTNASGTWIGIENDFVINDDSDNPQKIGECMDLPNNYISICFDSLNVADSDYATYVFEYESSADFSQSGGAYASQTSEPAIFIHTDIDEGLEIEIDGTTWAFENISSDTKTKQVWISTNDSNRSLVDVMYKDKDDNKVKYAGAVAIDNRTVGGGTAPTFLRTRYKDTKGGIVAGGTGVEFNLSVGNGSAFTLVNLSANTNGDSTSEMPIATDNLHMQWGISSSDFVSLGPTATTEEGGELQWQNQSTFTNIGSKDEDHRMKYGIIVKNPKSESSSDTVTLKVPADQLQANIVIKGTVVSGGSAGSVASAAVMTDDQITELTAQNLIAVGGPCANSVTAQLMGADKTWPACATGFTAGNAIIELKQNGSKWAVIAAGYSADDTRRAGVVLKNADTKLGSAVAGKSKVTVSGTTLEVSGITVA